MPSNDRIVAQIIAEAWADDQFRRRLLANPAEVMRERGIDVPAGVRIVMLENTPDTRHVVLPQKPRDFEEGASVQAAIRSPTVPFYLFEPGPRGGRAGGTKGGGRKRTR